MVSRIAGTLALLLALTLGGASVDGASPPADPAVQPSPPPLTTNLPRQVAATIAALQQLGAGGTAAGIAYVENYAHPNDNGGGVFLWLPAATAQPDNCLTFAAQGVSTGLWQRQLNGIPFNADMCGTGNADDSIAINAAFKVCVANQLPLTFPAKRYKLLGGLVATPGCSFYGAGRFGFHGATATVFDFHNAPASVTTLMSVIGNPVFGNYGPGGGVGFGGFEILDGYQLPRTGLYISRISNIHVSEISAYGVLGTGIFLGQQQESSYRGLYVYESGSPTAAELDIDGENSDGHDYASTTTSLYDIYVEVAGKQGTPCGIAINRNELLTITGGGSENNGNLVCIANKPATTIGVLEVSIEHFDMENPSAPSSCVTIGNGWAGKPGGGAFLVRLVGDACIMAKTSGASAFSVSNTNGFFAEANFVNQFPSSQNYFNFTGTNSNIALGINGGDGVQMNYVVQNGAPIANALFGRPWSSPAPAQ
jgi:hypothetical protein